MVYVMFAALSAIASMLLAPVQGRLNGYASRATNTRAQQFLGSYAGRTAVGTASFFIVLVVAASVMSVIVGRKATSIPTPV